MSRTFAPVEPAFFGASSSRSGKSGRGPGRGFGEGAAPWIALSVSLPTSPSTSSPFRCWKSRTAWSRPGPKPGPPATLNASHAPGAARSNHAWRSRLSCVTAGPRSPRLRMPFLAVVVAAPAFFALSGHRLGRGRAGEHGQRLRPCLAVDLECVPHLELANGVLDRGAVERPGLDLERVPDARRLAVEPRLQVALELHDVLASRALLEWLATVAHLEAPPTVAGLDRRQALQHVAPVVASGGLPVGVAAAEAFERTAGAGVVCGAGVLEQLLGADSLLLAEAQVRREHRCGELGRVREPRRRARAGGSVLREPVAVEAVVDLEQPATMTGVADLVLHVRLSRSNREQKPRGQIVALLRLRHDRQPPARACAADLPGEVIGADLHRALPRIRSPSTLQASRRQVKGRL